MKNINKINLGFTLQVLAVLVIFGYPSNSINNKQEALAVHGAAAINNVTTPAMQNMLPGNSTEDFAWPGITNYSAFITNEQIKKDKSHSSETGRSIKKQFSMHIPEYTGYNRNSNFWTNQLMVFKNTFR